MLLELFEAVGWHVPASLEIVLAAPVEGVEVEFKGAEGFGEGVEDLDSGFGDVDANAIARDGGNSEDATAFADIGWHSESRLCARIAYVEREAGECGRVN